MPVPSLFGGRSQYVIARNVGFLQQIYFATKKDGCVECKLRVFALGLNRSYSYGVGISWGTAIK